MHLAYQKAGATIPAINLLRKALLRSTYHPATAHGISNKANSHSSESPFFGPGQGSCDGTAAWVHTCDALIEVHKEGAKGIHISDPTTENVIDVTINTFIDDIKLFNAYRDNSKTKVIQAMTKDAQRWINILWSSGGIANLLKSLRVPILWNFGMHGRPHLDTERQYNITLVDPSTQDALEFKTKRPDEPSKYLGV